MTEVLHSGYGPDPHFTSSPSSFNDGSHQNQDQILINPRSPLIEQGDLGSEQKEQQDQNRDPLSLVALLVTAFRKSLVACTTDREELCSMEIGFPTNVRHIAHVTFDRFNGFLGLPVEFEPEVPRRAPSASASVFGVSTESMQCSYDNRGNSVPTILLLMQRSLYSQGGLRAEGIFRINAENSHEEYVRDQLNTGIVPDGIDVHCLAGLIKAWFRELPHGVLDSLSPEQVMQSHSEEECARLVRLLPSTEGALLDWAINLMADVVQEEQQNKMNARNVAMVFAPNMTQMADPLTALMYAVQVMNVLKTLILKTLKEREESILEAASSSYSEPPDGNERHSSSQPCVETQKKEETVHISAFSEPVLDGSSHRMEENSTTDDPTDNFQTSEEKAIPEANGFPVNSPSEGPTHAEFLKNESLTALNGLKTGSQANVQRQKTGNLSYLNLNVRKSERKVNGQSIVRATVPAEKSRGISIVSRINSRVERVEAWR